MKKYLVIFVSSLVFFFIGLLIGWGNRGADTSEVGIGTAITTSQSSSTGRKDEPTARRNGSFQPLRDQRGFLALEDLPTEEQRIMALYRMLDDATPENIKQLVDQYLAMTSGAKNRLHHLTGGINFGVSLMQCYGKLMGAEAVRFLRAQQLPQFTQAAIRGFVSESPQAAMASFASLFSDPEQKGDEYYAFVNETALAVLKKKISLQEWQAFIHDSDISEDFVTAISALAEGKALSETMTESLDMVDREYLLGQSPEYISLLDDMRQFEFTLDHDGNNVNFDRLNPEERIVAVNQIIGNSSLAASVKAVLLRQYLTLSSYDDLNKHFSPLWKTLSEESKKILLATNFSDISELKLEPAEIGDMLRDKDTYEGRMFRLVDGQDEPISLLNAGEYLDSSQRKSLIGRALVKCNFEDPVAEIRKWGEQAAFLSDDEYQWLQVVTDEQEKINRAYSEIHALEANLKKMSGLEE